MRSRILPVTARSLRSCPSAPDHGSSISGFLDYLGDPFTREILLELSVEHLQLVLVPIVLATAVGVLLGVTAHRQAWLRPPIINTSATFLTIPSLALFSLLIPVIGIGSPPVVVALTMYALLAIVRNTVSGLAQVDDAVIESARGMGLSNLQRLVQIELPNAWPVILTGIRVSAQLVVGIAAIAAVIGGPGLGNEIYSNGIRRVGSPGAVYSVIGGTLGILAIAGIVDGIFRLVGRFTISKGLQ